MLLDAATGLELDFTGYRVVGGMHTGWVGGAGGKTDSNVHVLAASRGLARQPMQDSPTANNTCAWCDKIVHFVQTHVLQT